MDKLSYNEAMAILNESKRNFIRFSREGVFVDTMGIPEEDWLEYATIREMETKHPQKDITKPLFIFPCAIEELRRILHDCDEYDQIAGVIHLDMNKNYSASEIIELMVKANLIEIQQHVPDELCGWSGLTWKQHLLLRNHQENRTYYEEEMLKRIRRYALPDCKPEQLGDITFKHLDDVINWLQGLRFAVFESSPVQVQKRTLLKDTLTNLILRTLRELGFEAKALPKAGNRGGAKSAVWKKIGAQFVSRNAFDEYWKSLRATGEIADAK